jgi:nucleoside-diphosphate-sugar epimerase
MLVSGHVRIDTEPVRENVTRDDVAAVLYAVLHEPRSVRQISYVGDGEDSIEQALAKALGGN